ncbi:hypothetical protein T11_8406 [Trichinella zimbabwensis]|uniref:Uncharacterized protein n=1 Tax=Trichinella zimbabwensis TaxID=268475 RepID=A0A0V1HBX7_9BILA|nr:hypothetical protein T11_8406 [Trichinella zimbabwensis]
MQIKCHGDGIINLFVGFIRIFPELCDELVELRVQRSKNNTHNEYAHKNWSTAEQLTSSENSIKHNKSIPIA